MSGETPLAEPVTGFYITITNQNTVEGDVIHESELKLNKCGGAHITNAESLIMIIEDAVFGEIGDG